jgi:tripartite-type tricarboxylate transporter receptor subunit TctC
MGRQLGQAVIIDNRAGAGGIIGYEMVAKQSPADGHALSLAAVQTLASIAVGVKDLRFDPLRDLVPITNIVEGRFILGSPSVAPWKTLPEMIAYAKANPGKLNYGSSSSFVRLTTEALLRAAAIQVTHVPYKDGAIYGIALGANEVQLGFINENQALALGDKLRVIGVTGDQRLPPFLDAPTFKSMGYPQIPSITFSLNVRSGTPRPVMDKLHAAAVSALKLPEVQGQFGKMKFDAVIQSQEDAVKYLAETGKLFADIAKSIGLEPQ